LIGKHTLPAEFTSEHLHFRGALAMGRTYQGNPDKRSSSYDFYLVVGRKVTSVELSQLQTEKGRTYTADQKKALQEYGRVTPLGWGAHRFWSNDFRLGGP
jgi:hypothetical protein